MRGSVPGGGRGGRTGRVVCLGTAPAQPRPPRPPPGSTGDDLPPLLTSGYARQRRPAAPASAGNDRGGVELLGRPATRRRRARLAPLAPGACRSVIAGTTPLVRVPAATITRQPEAALWGGWENAQKRGMRDAGCGMQG
jgi:hypothetical protein